MYKDRNYQILRTNCDKFCFLSKFVSTVKWSAVAQLISKIVNMNAVNQKQYLQ